MLLYYLFNKLAQQGEKGDWAPVGNAVQVARFRNRYKICQRPCIWEYTIVTGPCDTNRAVIRYYLCYTIVTGPCDTNRAVIRYYLCYTIVAGPCDTNRVVTYWSMLSSGWAVQ